MRKCVGRIRPSEVVKRTSLTQALSQQVWNIILIHGEPSCGWLNQLRCATRKLFLGKSRCVSDFQGTCFIFEPPVEEKVLGTTDTSYYTTSNRYLPPYQYSIL